MSDPIVVNAYCKFCGYFWKAWCVLDGIQIETQKHVHAGYRQAFDELTSIIESSGYSIIRHSMIAPKFYAVEVSKKVAS